jgi:hypothetical protein
MNNNIFQNYYVIMGLCVMHNGKYYTGIELIHTYDKLQSLFPKLDPLLY